MKKHQQTEKLNISEFKAHALRLLDDTWKKGQEYTITKKGVPIARVIPLKKQKLGESFGGSLKGFVEIKGDIVSFDTSEDWEVLK